MQGFENEFLKTRNEELENQMKVIKENDSKLGEILTNMKDHENRQNNRNNQLINEIKVIFACFVVFVSFCAQSVYHILLCSFFFCVCVCLMCALETIKNNARRSK